MVKTGTWINPEQSTSNWALGTAEGNFNHALARYSKCKYTGPRSINKKSGVSPLLNKH